MFAFRRGAKDSIQGLFPRFSRNIAPQASSVQQLSKYKTTLAACSTSPWSGGIAPVRSQQQQQHGFISQKRLFLPSQKLNVGLIASLSSQPPTTPKPSDNGGGSSRMAQGAGLLGAASLLFGKTKYVLAALKVTKLAPLGSMLLSIGAYSMIFGVPYAVGVVGLIFVHECGHAAVMHQRGIEFSPMVFLPFMGAVIAMRNHPRDAWEDALVAAGGPVAGSMGAAAVAVAAGATDSQLLYALADFGFMVNLFNLLPIGSMDGGRWVGALSPYVGVAGIGLGGYIAYHGLVSNPLFYLIWLAGAYDTFQRFYYPNHLPPNFYKISTGQRAMLTVGYFGLVAALLAAMAANQQQRKSPEQIIREQNNEVTWNMM